MGKSAQKNPPGKSPAKSSKIYTTKILQHISADCPGQHFSLCFWVMRRFVIVMFRAITAKADSSCLTTCTFMCLPMTCCTNEPYHGNHLRRLWLRSLQPQPTCLLDSCHHRHRESSSIQEPESVSQRRPRANNCSLANPHKTLLKHGCSGNWGRKGRSVSIYFQAKLRVSSMHPLCTKCLMAICRTKSQSLAMEISKCLFESVGSLDGRKRAL